jgi:hypothetical protein
VVARKTEQYEETDVAQERELELENEVPREASGLPDDRFDGTDSGPGGKDTPYPPIDEAAAAPNSGAADRAAPEPGSRPATGEPAEGSAAATGRHPGNPALAVDGASYQTDGPDEPVDRPQR